MRLLRVVVCVLLLLVCGAVGRVVIWRWCVRCSLLRGLLVVEVGCCGGVVVCWGIPWVMAPRMGLARCRCWVAVTGVGRLRVWGVAVPLRGLLVVWLCGVGRRVGPWAHRRAVPVQDTFGRPG